MSDFCKIKMYFNAAAGLAFAASRLLLLALLRPVALPDNV